MIAKTVLVTGASRGIGRAIAIRFGQAGYNVVVNYLSSEEKAQQTVENIKRVGGNAIAFKADVSDYKAVEALKTAVLAQFGKVDVLVNNAGIACSKLLFDTTREDFDKIVNTNFGGVYNVTHAFLEEMIARGAGKIVNISSVFGITGGSSEVVYSASKAAVIGFSKALAKELAYSNIQVNAIAPGAIATDMTNFKGKELEALLLDIPSGRLGSAEEIAEAAFYLASDKANYITGQVLTIDGGFSF